MQDVVRDKSVALAIKVGKAGGRLTADLLKWAMRKYLTQSGNPNIHHGKQSVKQLVGQGAGVKSVEITDKNIRSFERVAKKYGVDYALKKNPETNEYYVFFKARDDDAMKAAFAEFTAKTVHVKSREKPSVRQQLAHFKEVVKNMARDTTKERDRGGHER